MVPFPRCRGAVQRRGGNQDGGKPLAPFLTLPGALRKGGDIEAPYCTTGNLNSNMTPLPSARSIAVALPPWNSAISRTI